jgi:hypothetical protein
VVTLLLLALLLLAVVRVHSSVRGTSDKLTVSSSASSSDSGSSRTSGESLLEATVLDRKWFGMNNSEGINFIMYDAVVCSVHTDHSTSLTIASLLVAGVCSD